MTRSRMRSRGIPVAMLLAAVVTAAGGCSGRGGEKWRQRMPPTHRALGTVTYQGSPLIGATVVFHPREGVAASRRAAVGLTDPEGRFVLTTVKPGDGAVAGPYRVTVEKTTVADPGAMAVPPDEFGAFPLGADPSTAKPLIPATYFSPHSSGLTAEVDSRGRNEFVFSLD